MLIDIEIDSREELTQLKAHLEWNSALAVTVGRLYIEGPADCPWTADDQDVEDLVVILARVPNLEYLCVRIPGFNDPRVHAALPAQLQADNIELV